MSEAEASYEPVPAGSRLGRTLEGLDPNFALTNLDDFSRREIELRYGLKDGKPRKAQAVAYRMGCAKSHVRAVERKALIKLRQVRDEYRPERVFEREKLPEIDNAYLSPALISPAAVYKSAKLEELLNQAHEPSVLEEPRQASIALKGLLNLLSSRERQAIEMKFGIGPIGPLNRAEIAERLGVTASSVGRIITRVRNNMGPEIEQLIEASKPPLSIANNSQFLSKAVKELSLMEVELLDLMERGFSDSRIGRELAIHARYELGPLRKQVADKLGVEPKQLVEIAPDVLKLAGER